MGGASLLAGAASESLGNLAGTVGGLGASLYLAKYSREDERQADELGMEYMVGGGYAPQGMVGLMDVLRSMSRRQPSAIEAMFSSHPMSVERYDTAVARSRTRFGGSQNLPVYRERYMDSIASLRRLAPMFKFFQEGDKAMGAKEYQVAQGRYAEGLKISPNDYAGLVMMSKCQIAQKKERPLKIMRPGRGGSTPPRRRPITCMAWRPSWKKTTPGPWRIFRRTSGFCPATPPRCS